jgi:serine/threonine protein kinase
VGSGKFGLVRKARHLKTNKDYAIKIINKQKLQENDILLIQNEIEILKVCQHPNIIRIYNIYENYNNIYIGIYKLTPSNGIV